MKDNFRSEILRQHWSRQLVLSYYGVLFGNAVASCMGLHIFNCMGFIYQAWYALSHTDMLLLIMQVQNIVK